MSVFHYFKVRKIVTHKIKVILRDNDPLFTTIGYILQFEAVFNFWLDGLTLLLVYFCICKFIDYIIIKFELNYRILMRWLQMITEVKLNNHWTTKPDQTWSREN